MHSRLAAAAENVPSLKAGLAIYSNEPPQLSSKFESALLLRWARHVEKVNVHDSTLGCHGLCEFLASATSAASIDVRSHSLLAAAQADRLLCACSAVNHLSLSGSFMPSTFPRTVTDLQVDFSRYGKPRVDAQDAVQCDALLYRAASLPCLRQLLLSFSGYMPAQLTCPIKLRQLQVLYLGLLNMDSTDANLSWVQLQACPNFSCSVSLHPTNSDMHDDVVARFSPLTIKRLDLYVDIRFSCHMQKLWSQLNNCSLILSFDDMPFTTASEALQILPLSCTKVILEARNLSWDRVIYVSSTAFFSQAANIRVITESCACVEILGAGDACMAAANEMQRPWQFVVQGAKSVHGLPASLATNKTYFLQNAAACSAGWTDDTD